MLARRDSARNVLLTLAGCLLLSLPAAAQDPSISSSDLLNGVYDLPDGVIRLSGGAHRMRYEDASGSELVVSLGETRTFGDLDRDGTMDAAATLTVRPGESGEFVYLAAVMAGSGRSAPGITILLGNRLQVDSLTIREGAIVVFLRTHAAGDPDCCPTLAEKKGFALAGGRLVPSPPAQASPEPSTLKSQGGSQAESPAGTPPAEKPAEAPSAPAEVMEIHVAPPPLGRATGDGSRDAPLSDLAEAVLRGALWSAAGGDRPKPPVPGQTVEPQDQAAPPAGRSVRILLAPGHYWLAPTKVTEPTCGNCETPQEPVPVTVGLRVSGAGMALIGAPEYASVIHTQAGYGLLFQDCEDCTVQGIVLTDGARDSSGNATDAAVVAQRSSLRVDDCWIRDNIGDPKWIEKNVVGIMGICGREDSRLMIVNNRITRNSWDGIALYRGAQAEIRGNTIDGVDMAVGGAVGGGRGVGIGVTWNARAWIRGNRVARYWKGIGLFADAQATVEENVVEQVATWGLSLWDAGSGHPQGYFRYNAVDSTGACGAMIARGSGGAPEAGALQYNTFSRTGQNPRYDSGEPYCMQTAVAVHDAPRGFLVDGNVFHRNRGPEGHAGSGDLDLETFRTRTQPVLERLARWPSTASSAFYQRMVSRSESAAAQPTPGLGASSLEDSDPAGR